MKQKIRGCLIGGAAGDALGYPVEFDTEAGILDRYGSSGITEYERDSRTGLALISDDTQMTLFTATGMLFWMTRYSSGRSAYPRYYVQYNYEDWYRTQVSSYEIEINRPHHSPKDGASWLREVPEFYARRAPGNTCLSALGSGNADLVDPIANPINQSKGCCGVMRVAPVALACHTMLSDLPGVDMEAAQIAALTHGHPLGYIPAAVLCHIVGRSLENEGQLSFLEIVIDAMATAEDLFTGTPEVEILIDLLGKAITLSRNNHSDLENIHELGEGWVAEEALAIAVYCSLRYSHDFSKALIASVNHKGDSDSTGAITGNILGSFLGLNAIEDKWMKDLELKDLILEIADDLSEDLEYEPLPDSDWGMKYIQFHRPNFQEAAEDHLLFCEPHELFGEFSNSYASKFVIDDFEYFCMEQYLMAQKARCFHDSTRYTAILRAQNAKECHDLGAFIKGYDPTVWKDACVSAAKTGLKAKFTQNSDLLQLLLSTDNQTLVYASAEDPVWGAAVSVQEALKIPSVLWQGQNLLGQCLMEIRSELRLEQSTAAILGTKKDSNQPC